MNRKIGKMIRLKRRWLSVLCIIALLIPGVTAKGFSGPYMPEECVTLTPTPWSWSKNLAVTAYYPEKNNEYQQLSLPGAFSNLLGEKLFLTRIDNSVFRGETFSEIYVEMVNDLVIGQRAFQNVTVEDVEGSPIEEHTVEFLGDTMGGIEEYAFLSMSTSGDFTINKIKGSIGNGAFQDAVIEGTFLLVGEIDTIGKNAFMGFRCGEFKIGATVKRIEDGAFKKTSWSGFKLADSVQYLGSGLFEDSALTRLTLPDSNEMKEVAEDAFPDKEDLTIVIPAEDIDLSVYHFDQYENVLFQTVEDIAEDSPVLQYLKKYHLKYRIGENGETVIPPEATPTPSATPEPSASAMPSPEIEPTPMPEATPTPPVSPSSSPEAETTPTPTPEASVSPSPDTEITPTPTPDVNAGITPEPLPSDSETPSVNMTPSPTSSPTGSPSDKKAFTKKKLNYRITGKNQVSVTGTADRKITKIKIPDTVTYQERLYKVTSISPKAFKGLPKCKKILVGNYVKTIGDEAFCRCKNLRRISFGRNLSEMGKKVLYQDKGIRKIIFLGDKLKKIGQKTFSGVYKKVGITAPRRKAARYKKMIGRAT